MRTTNQIIKLDKVLYKYLFSENYFYISKNFGDHSRKNIFENTAGVLTNFAEPD